MAPVRICDNGGWTDTWFAKYGSVFNIAVSPYTEIQIEAFPYQEGNGQVEIWAENYRYPTSDCQGRQGYDDHPLLTAIIEHIGLPRQYAVKITLYSDAPPGGSIGTSASLTVSLVGALDRLRGGTWGPAEIAKVAHAVETDHLGQQSGVQDQLCSVYGGINFIEIMPYPHATRTGIQVPYPIWWELERRLVLVYLGKSHCSTSVHEHVIQEIEGRGSEYPPLKRLRAMALRSREAVSRGDFDDLGKAMIENSEAQGDLSASLISTEAQQVMAIAREHGAVGWKPNGAGGEGGSITLLCNSSASKKRALIRTIESANPLYRNVPIALSRSGLRVWEVLYPKTDR
jgi:D-glycero-alpha-D-manno-heptose-7-phosphate kinase